MMPFHSAPPPTHSAARPFAVLVERQQGIGHLQRMHFPGADHHHTDTDALRGQRQRHETHETVARRGIVLHPDAVDAVTFRLQAELGDLRRRHIGLEDDVDFHCRLLCCLRFRRIRARHLNRYHKAQVSNGHSRRRGNAGGFLFKNIWCSG
jgi:hypothetical protein